MERLPCEFLVRLRLERGDLLEIYWKGWWAFFGKFSKDLGKKDFQNEPKQPERPKRPQKPNIWNEGVGAPVDPSVGTYACVYDTLYHKYLMEADCSLGNLSLPNWNKKLTLWMSQVFTQHCEKRKRLMHQVFNICWQMVNCCWCCIFLYSIYETLYLALGSLA